MESESLYAESTESPTPRYGGFWPLNLLSFSLLLVLSWQLFMNVQTSAALRNAREQRKNVVQQSQQLQGSLEKLVLDLLELAKTDSEAKAIVDKYKIQQNK